MSPYMEFTVWSDLDPLCPKKGFVVTLSNLTVSQTTKFRLFQTERIFSRQFQIC